MKLSDHLRVTGRALGHWIVAQTLDALAVGALWLVGLLVIHVPWAPLWAVLGGLLQFIPGIGTPLALVAPSIAAVVTGGLDRLLRVLILYVILVAVDAIILQPYLMKRTARVPLWASLLIPPAFGLVLGFWGVLLAAPVLAVMYAYRARVRP